MGADTQTSAGVYQVATAYRTVSLRPGGRVGIGRHPDNELVLDHTSVSRFHARLAWEVGATSPVVADLGSLNGTLLDGVRVLRAPLGEWTALRVGSVDVSVCLSHPALVPSTGATLVRMFDEWAPDERGHVDGAVGLQQLLLALERARRTVELELAATDFSARLIFARGQVVAARAQGLEGCDALRRLLFGQPPPVRYRITPDVHVCEGATAVSVRALLRQAAPLRSLQAG